MDETSSRNTPYSSRRTSRSAAFATCANVLAALMLLLTTAAFAHAQTTAPPALLQLESKIPLGSVTGRIDHMAIDLARRLLLVAELGNGSISVVDLNENKVIKRITGLKEPQGIGHVPSTDTIYVASGGDGLVTVLAGSDLSLVGHIKLGDDADNVRVDRDGNRVVVGYGSGGLAVIDADRRAKIADIALKAHPEGFQIDRASKRIFVNVPDAGEIAVVDLGVGRQIAVGNCLPPARIFQWRSIRRPAT